MACSSKLWALKGSPFAASISMKVAKSLSHWSLKRLKRQRVIDTPCPIARYTIGWCQLEVRAMTRSWNGAWFGQTGYIMYINIYKLKLRRACYHFLPWRAWEWRVYVGAIYLHLRNSVISSNKEWPWDILSSLTHQWNLGIISCNSDMPSLKCAPFTETCEACIYCPPSHARSVRNAMSHLAWELCNLPSSASLEHHQTQIVRSPPTSNCGLCVQ